MSARNSLQYKQFLCVLILSKCNAEFIDQICIIYSFSIMSAECINYRPLKQQKT